MHPINETATLSSTHKSVSNSKNSRNHMGNLKSRLASSVVWGGEPLPNLNNV